MQVLHWTFSNKFEQYYTQCMSEINQEIIWNYVHNIPNNLYCDYQGAHDPCPGANNFILYLNRDLSTGLAEIIAAHELTHHVLSCQGYPTVALTALGNQNPAWATLSTHLMSSLEDVIIDKLLESVGFIDPTAIKGYNNVKRDLLTKGVIHFPPDGDAIRHNALGFLYLKYALPSGKWKELKTLYHKFQPDVYKMGIKLLKICDSIGFDTSEKCFQCTVAMRDFLQLKHFMEIVNPVTMDRY